MVLPRVVLCTRSWNMDNGISIKWADYGFTGQERCSGLRVGDKMALPF